MNYYYETVNRSSSSIKLRAEMNSRPMRKDVSIDKEVKGHVDDHAGKGEPAAQHLSEVDREWYNIRIGDLEAKLKRSVHF